VNSANGTLLFVRSLIMCDFIFVQVHCAVFILFCKQVRLSLCSKRLLTYLHTYLLFIMLVFPLLYASKCAYGRFSFKNIPNVIPETPATHRHRSGFCNRKKSVHSAIESPIGPNLQQPVSWPVIPKNGKLQEMDLRNQKD